MAVRVQREDFDPGQEIAALTANNKTIGGLTVFVGLVREMAKTRALSAMTLEHYPGMTERMLERIEAEARERWPLEESLIIHRYGRLEPGDRIVLVAAASAHRDAAFEACRFLIDWLKTKAPFWKLEEDSQGDATWVEARESDEEAADRWQ
ncbi:MAG TPA: molybdenum cofactor biosynthesis protein MoaE [Kiloniellales bacterium]|jgi:molybdopterin synthase catalytic subunit|nr:molybdenum cofactor biosynthesis protein MoaE [Kiloniellales bacterium]